MNEPDLNGSNEEPSRFDASDEDLERASGAYHGGVPTLLGTYCFTCPSGQEIASGVSVLNPFAP